MQAYGGRGWNRWNGVERVRGSVGEEVRLSKRGTRMQAERALTGGGECVTRVKRGGKPQA